MKILIVSVDFPPHTDGVSTVSHELATRLSKAGEEIIVIGPRAKGDREYDSQQKFKVIRTTGYAWGYLRIIPILFVMPWMIMRHRIKLVIPMNIAYGGIISYLLFRIFGFSYIMWAYGYEFGKFEKNRFFKNLYLKIYNNSLYICAITEFVKKKLFDFGVRPEKIVLIKPGTDPAKFYPSLPDTDFLKRYNLENKRIILSVGRIIERKGMDTTIRALKDVLKVFPNVVYLIVGSGPYKHRLEELACESGVADAVRFMGRLSADELCKCYNACDLFIMPSRTIEEKGDVEGFGIVFLEAGACGKPVIGGSDGGMSEAIENRVTGLLVNPLNTKEISEAIIGILSDKNYAKKLGENGRKRVLEELNWERAIQTFRGYL